MSDRENKDKKRGLASADEETRERVAREGGQSSHGDQGQDKSSIDSDNRGFASMSEEERKRIASKGGKH